MSAGAEGKKEGFLWKQGGNRKNWKKRHFTVAQDPSTKRWAVTYFTDDATPKKKGELYLGADCTVDTEDTAPEPKMMPAGAQSVLEEELQSRVAPDGEDWHAVAIERKRGQPSSST